MSEQLKQQPPTSIKKQNSYTYWVGQNNKSRDLPPEHRPKKVEGPVQPVTSEQGPSAWNSCGTWQQKKIPFSQIIQGTKQNMQKMITENGWDLELGQVKLEGQAYKVYKKNKWNVMYQIKGSVEFKKQENKAKFKIQELTDMGDREYELTGNSEIRKLIQTKTNQLLKAVESVLVKYNS